jgi:probable rRNA maturation factor
VPILLNNLQEIQPVGENQLSLLEKVLEYGLHLHRRGNAEVSVVLVDNQYIRELNSQYRGVDQPTDVLSFPVEGEDFVLPDGAPQLLGDIFISIERTREQSESYGHSFERELCYLAVHGLLHLLGFDHHQDDETTRMREEEERVMREFALGRTTDGEITNPA